MKVSNFDLKNPGFSVLYVKHLIFLDRKITVTDVKAPYGVNAFDLMEYFVSTTIKNKEELCDQEESIWSAYVKKHDVKEDLVVPSYNLSMPGEVCFLFYDHEEGVWSKKFFDRVEGFCSSLRVSYFTKDFS